MTYIWINPVTEHMYDGPVLIRFLEKHDLEWVRCGTDWGRIVKDKYIKMVEEGDQILADARCPMASGLVSGLAGPSPGLRVADIEPILIHCAREISSREDLKDGRKLITTPCKALADMGNGLMLPNTCFVTWNGFLDALGQRPEAKALDASPIPPGFFSSLGGCTGSLTGKEAIERFVKEESWKFVKEDSWKKVRLVEMLYCDMGCHNGDGVVQNEG